MGTFAVLWARSIPKRQSMIGLVCLAALCLPAAKGQDLGPIALKAASLVPLLEAGNYAEATKLAKSILDRAPSWPHDYQLAAIRAYVGKTALEVGDPRSAAKILDSVLPGSPTQSSNFYEGPLLRERAAAYYALADYERAAQEAAEATRLFEEWHFPSIRTEYCRSLQILASLRMGKLAQAERLTLKAVKVAPKKPSHSPIYAPRILFAACIVESYVGKYKDAAGFCTRGLEIAALSKRETRDLALGQLAAAEMYLRFGDLVRAREAAQKSADVTARIFGPRHQDMVDALNLLARISWHQGDLATARTRADAALKLANVVFGEGSRGADIPLLTLHNIDAASPKVQR